MKLTEIILFMTLIVTSIKAVHATIIYHKSGIFDDSNTDGGIYCDFPPCGFDNMNVVDYAGPVDDIPGAGDTKKDKEQLKDSESRQEKYVDPYATKPADQSDTSAKPFVILQYSNGQKMIIKRDDDDRRTKDETTEKGRQHMKQTQQKQGTKMEKDRQSNPKQDKVKSTTDNKLLHSQLGSSGVPDALELNFWKPHGGFRVERRLDDINDEDVTMSKADIQQTQQKQRVEIEEDEQEDREDYNEDNAYRPTYAKSSHSKASSSGMQKPGGAKQRMSTCRGKF